MNNRTIHSRNIFNNAIERIGYLPPIIVGYNIKTPENIGNIIRLADNSGCKEVLFVTNDENLRNSKIKKTASSSFNSINWSFCKESELVQKIPTNYKYIAIETSSDSNNIYQTNLPPKVVLIVGNEINGIDSKFLDKCHEIVHIPMLGNNTSMNVSHALAVALFEWQRQVCNY